MSAWLKNLASWAAVMVLFYAFWLVFGNGYEPTVFYSE